MIKLRESTNQSHTWLAFEIGTPHDDDDQDHNMLHIAIGKFGWFFDVPRFIKPKSVWKDTPSGGYMNHIQRTYGFSFTEDSCHVHHGIQPGCWLRDDPANSDHVKLFDYPWNFKHVRWDCYFTDGQWASTGEYFRKWEREVNAVPYNKDTKDADFLLVKWFPLPANASTTLFSDVETDKPVYKFYEYIDRYDGSLTLARVNIEEREWIRGKWKWLRSVLKHVPGCRMVNRYLEINFRDPVGSRKNTWKGGTLGMTAEMRAGETINEAWTRFVVRGDHP